MKQVNGIGQVGVHDRAERVVQGPQLVDEVLLLGIGNAAILQQADQHLTRQVGEEIITLRRRSTCVAWIGAVRRK